MSFSVRLTKRWREILHAQTRQIEHLILHAQCRCCPSVVSPTTLNFTTKLAGISCSGGVPLLNSSPTRTVGPTHTPAHSGGVAHLSELFAKIAAPPHPGEASGPSTAPARSRPSDRALPAAG